METYNFETRISGNVIHCRAFTLEEYLLLMKAKIDGTISETVKNILAECTDAKNLNKQESELLLLKLWAHSIGEVNHESTWVCPCGKETIVPINITHAQIPTPEDLWLIKGDIKIKFKYPQIFDDANISLMIAKCIDYIISNGEQIYVKDLTDQEVNDLYSIISVDDISAIKEMLLKPTVSMAVPIECSCGKKHIHEIRGLKEFFGIIQ